MVLIDSVYAKGGGIAQRKLLTSHPAVPGSNLGASDFLIIEILRVSSRMWLRNVDSNNQTQNLERM